jgi:hypothetical protein
MKKMNLVFKYGDKSYRPYSHPTLEEKLLIEKFFRDTNKLELDKAIDFSAADAKLIFDFIRFLQNLS